MKNLAILFFGLFILISNSYAQETTSELETFKAKIEKECSGAKAIVIGDSSTYELNWGDIDYDNRYTKGNLAMALNGIKDDFLIGVCIFSKENVKLGIYIKYTNPNSSLPFYFKIFNGQQTSEIDNKENGKILSFSLDSGNLKLIWSHGPDPERRFLSDINKFNLIFSKERFKISFFEDWDKMSTLFREKAMSGCFSRQEILVPMGNEDDEDEDEDEVEKISTKDMLGRLQNIGYLYSMMFLKVEEGEKKPLTFDADDLKEYGINLKALDNLPEALKIKMLFIGVMNQTDHIELDLFALFVEPSEDDPDFDDLIDFTQPLYSAKITVKGSKSTDGSLDEIVIMHQKDNGDKANLIWRKAAKNGFDIFNIFNGTGRSFSGAQWTPTEITEALYKPDRKTIALSAIFSKTHKVQAINMTEDIELPKAIIKLAINRMQKKWVKELLYKE